MCPSLRRNTKKETEVLGLFFVLYGKRQGADFKCGRGEIEEAPKGGAYNP